MLNAPSKLFILSDVGVNDTAWTVEYVSLWTRSFALENLVVVPKLSLALHFSLRMNSSASSDLSAASSKLYASPDEADIAAMVFALISVTVSELNLLLLFPRASIYASAASFGRPRRYRTWASRIFEYSCSIQSTNCLSPT